MTLKGRFFRFLRRLKLTKFEFLTLLLSVIAITSSIGGIWVNHAMEEKVIQEQQRTDQKNIAQAFCFDLATLQGRFENDISYMNKMDNYTVFYETEPYIQENSVYYTFNKEIAYFPDYQLSTNLYNFYQTVKVIEKKRSDLQQIDSKLSQQTNPNSPSTIQLTAYDSGNVHSEYESLKTNIILANENAKEIDNELQEDYGVNGSWLYAGVIQYNARTFHLSIPV